MAIKKSTSASVNSKPEVHNHKDLESKIASLESKITSMEKALAEHEAKSEKEHAALAQKCEACCSAKSGGKDTQLRLELKKYFSTLNSSKNATVMPDLD
jgi:ABC-type polar amino acid transport system ATPase subunit